MKKRTKRLMVAGIVVFAVAAGISGIYLYRSNQQDIFQKKLAAYDIPLTYSTEGEIQEQDSFLDQIYKEIEQSKERIENEKLQVSGDAYPSEILPCTRSGDDLLVLVNKQYQLPSTYAPSDLIPIENSGVRVTKSGMHIRSVIVSNLSAMAVAAAGQGIDLAVLSAYRSYNTQQSTYNYWVNYNGGDTNAADTVSARPGHSQHQLGTAVDFTSNEISDQLGQHFGNTAAGTWLAQHAWEYGFALAYPSGHEATTGYSYEPWHFRYIGKENATEWHGSGEILEVWLRGKN